MVPKLAKKFGGRQVIGAGFVTMTAGFAAIGFADASWVYATFLLPLVAIAMGMGLSNGPSSSAATAAVPAEQVGEASGVSNMARYVGAAVATALAATIYGTVTDNQRGDGASAGDALASGLAAASWAMVVFSALGILLALVAILMGACRTGHRAGRGGIGRSPPAHVADNGRPRARTRPGCRPSRRPARGSVAVTDVQCAPGRPSETRNFRWGVGVHVTESGLK